MVTFFEIGQNVFLFTPGTREVVQFQLSENSLTFLMFLRPHHFVILRFCSIAALQPPMLLDLHTFTKLLIKTGMKYVFITFRMKLSQMFEQKES